MEKKIVNKNNKKKTTNLLIMIFAAITIAFLIVLSGVLHNTLNTERIEKINLIEDSKSMGEKFKQKTYELQYCREDMMELKSRLEGIKNNTDLLKRDIFLYIDKKFQIVPQSVALYIADKILSISKKEKISPELIMAIIQVESGFNPMAISKANARGLMQVMPEWAPKFNLKRVSDLHDIDTGIEIGVKVLNIHIDEAKGNISKGLYYYVGKSDTYSGKVYEAIGKFVSFRSTVDDEKPLINKNKSDKKEKVK